MLTLDENFCIEREVVVEVIAKIDQSGPKITGKEITARLGYVPRAGEIDTGLDGLLGHALYKYVPFPRTLPTAAEPIRDSPIYHAFINAVKINPKAAAQGSSVLSAGQTTISKAVWVSGDSEQRVQRWVATYSGGVGTGQRLEILQGL